MQSDQIITLVAVVGAFILGGFFWWMMVRAGLRERELLHAERLAAIEKGLPPPDEPAPPQPAGGVAPGSPARAASNPLGTGLFWLFIGLGMIVALRIVYPASTSWGWGVIPVGLGLAYLVGIWLSDRLAGRGRPEEPGRDEGTR
jgi:hypothetical protein